MNFWQAKYPVNTLCASVVLSAAILGTFQWLCANCAHGNEPLCCTNAWIFTAAKTLFSQGLESESSPLRVQTNGVFW